MKRNEDRKGAPSTKRKSGLAASPQINDSPPSEALLSNRHPYALLFLLISLIYLCTLSDKVFDWISDGQVMFDTAVSVHEFGELGISPEVVDRNTGVSGTADYYGKYGLGLSIVEQVPLLMVPALEKILGGGKSNVLFAMMNMIITALTALVVALCLRDLGFRFRTGALAAIGFAFGTPAWPYISYDFSEPLQALCLVAAFWFLLRATKRHPPSPFYFTLAGLALGYGVFTKALLLILVPIYGLYSWRRLEGTSRKEHRSFGWFVLPLLVWGVAIAALNLHRFGSIFEFGYGGETTRFTTPLLTGLYGLLLSPTKGLIFYAPLTILLPWSWWKMRRSRHRELIFLLSIFVLHVATNSKWWSWEGGMSWGPRLLMPILPLMIISASTLLESVRWSLPVFGVCVVAGVTINLLGVLMNFLVWINAAGANQMRLPLEVRGRPAYQYAEHDGKRWYRPNNAMWYIPALSPLRGHAWLLRLRYFGVPFPLRMLSSDASVAPPRVFFPPIEIDFSLLKNAFALSHLRSAHFWLWETLTSQPREEIFSYPVYGVSIERQGDRAMARGDRERALECFRRAVELMPNYVSPALKLSRLLAEGGGSREGQDVLLRFLSQPNRNLDQERAARLDLAQLYENSGYREAALQQYRTYLTLQPTKENRARIEQHITELAAAGTPPH
ncbi:MAG: hypothetical protein LAO31_05490 [Acidobacteriia bacterium]|nr:hypothetical protein [Terriglobia bacterium]